LYLSVSKGLILFPLSLNSSGNIVSLKNLQSALKSLVIAASNLAELSILSTFLSAVSAAISVI